jgi:hypothetical membrane protein
VPVIHLIVGYFPATFTIHVVITMIAYYAIRIVMLLYCDSFKQMRALWFSRIAVSINWCVCPVLSISASSVLHVDRPLPYGINLSVSCAF